MEPLFENSYVRDKAVLREVYWYLWFRRPVYLVLNTIIAIIFLADIVSGIITKNFNTITVIFVPIYYLYKLYLYRRDVKFSMKQDIESNGEPIEVHTAITDETIKTATSNGSANEFGLSKIKNGFQSKNLIFLHTEAKLIYVFHKDNFTKGTPEEFITFIKSKGIKIR